MKTLKFYFRRIFGLNTNRRGQLLAKWLGYHGAVRRM